jgi:membrane-bound ClpP family serine protease
MAVELKIGDRAVTRGPLKPGGQIRVGERTFAAMWQGEWIDSNSEVEIVGGNQDHLLVRPLAGDAPSIA